MPETEPDIVDVIRTDTLGVTEVLTTATDAMEIPTTPLVENEAAPFASPFIPVAKISATRELMTMLAPPGGELNAPKASGPFPNAAGA